jgi:hypothetical protein
VKEPSLYQKIHWRLFNFGAHAFGYALVFVSTIFTLLPIVSYAGMKTGGEYPIWLLVLFIPLIAMGLLVARAKPYYPREYREWFEDRSKKR